MADGRPEERRPQGGGQVSAVDDQPDEGDDAVDTAEDQPPGRRGERELDNEQPSSSKAAARLKRNARINATPINVWLAVSKTSSTWRESSTREDPPPPNRWASGNDPISSVH